LLAGTGLTYRLSENRRTVSIVLAQNTTSSNDGSVFGVAQLPAIEIGAEANRIERGSGVRWNPRS
jgi:iron complex outermembrane receptor protein